ncbi:hypothetical protein D9M68_716610 [compost metagenome]
MEVLVEGDGRAQHAMVRAQVARRGVRQAHAPGLPVGAEKLPQQAQHHAQRQFDALARGAVRLAGLHFLADDHHLAEGLDHQRQRAVEQRLVAHQHVERIAQRRLFAHQQADGPEVRQPPPLGHAQPEGFVARALGRGLQQRGDAVDRNHQVGLVQHAGAQAGVQEHAGRVQAAGAGDLAVVGEACRADQGRHRKSARGSSQGTSTVAPVVLRPSSARCASAASASAKLCCGSLTMRPAST